MEFPEEGAGEGGVTNAGSHALNRNLTVWRRPLDYLWQVDRYRDPQKVFLQLPRSGRIPCAYLNLNCLKNRAPLSPILMMVLISSETSY